MFYNRKNELLRLNKRYQQERSQLLIVYGRRRVGKTELLQQFVKDKPHIYFLADLSSEKEQLAGFTERIRLFSKDPALTENPFSNWNALFAYIRNLAKKTRLVLIIDEYQYLQAGNKAISSILQKVWDEGLKDGKIYLVLCGSYISFMEREILAYKSPLYGRRTGQFFIEPLSFFQAAQFFPSLSIKERILRHGILGGIPAYLLQFQKRHSLAENIKFNTLQPDAFLYNETHFLLMQELREPRNYFSILKAIAFGATRLNEIVQSSGLDRGMVVKYIEVLKNLRIIKRQVSVHEEKPEKSRKGIYQIQDNYFRFWFRFVYPNKSFIEENQQDRVLREKIIPQLDQYTGAVFEEVCLEFLKMKNAQGQLPFEAAKIGRFWKDQMEIDIMAFDRESDIFCLANVNGAPKKSAQIFYVN